MWTAWHEGTNVLLPATPSCAQAPTQRMMMTARCQSFGFQRASMGACCMHYVCICMYAGRIVRMHAFIPLCTYALVHLCSMHTYTYTYIHTYIHTYISKKKIYIYISISIYIHTQTYIRKHIRTRSYMHSCIHVCIHTYVRTYIHTYMHTYIHAYIQTYRKVEI